MFVSWLHTWIPRFLCVFSLASNGFFCCLVKFKSTKRIGGYKYLLMTFGVFNSITSLLEGVVSLGIEGFNKCLIVFVSNSFASENIAIGQSLVSLRCSMLAFTYGLLGAHFIYRYLSVTKPMLILGFFRFVNILRIAVFVFLHGAIWLLVGHTFLWPDEYLRTLVRDGFRSEYNASSRQISMLVADYRYPSKEHWNKNGMIGMFVATGVSSFSAALYIFSAVSIRRKLVVSSISELTRKLHQNLLRALIVQTVVPIISTCFPCIVLWYKPILSDSYGRSLNSFVVPLLSLYPAVDPIIIVFLLTDYRNALFRMISQFKTTSSSIVAPRNRNELV